jgi:hypothetical protein
MYMILFTSYSNDIDIFFLTYSSNDDLETFDYFRCKDLSSILSYPDKVTCEIIGSMGRMVIIERVIGSRFW